MCRGLGKVGAYLCFGTKMVKKHAHTHHHFNLACAAAACPCDRHPEGCTDRRPRIPVLAPAGPHPGPRARLATLVRTCSGFQCGRSSWMRRRAPGRMSSWSTDTPKHGTAAALGGPGGSGQPALAAAFSSMPHEHCGQGACLRRYKGEPGGGADGGPAIPAAPPPRSRGAR